jgi:hypothetical protein
MILLSCGNEARMDKLFLGVWESTKKVIPYKAYLTIMNDHTFNFEYGACEARGFSQGTWQIDHNTIILNSNQPDSCYKTSIFGIPCQTVVYDSNKVDDALKNQDDCEPKSQKEYVIFNDSRFEFDLDTLIFRIVDTSDCPNYLGMEDIFIKKHK